MTMLSLQKTLGLLVMPAGLVWLLLMLACVLCLRRRQGRLALLLLVTVVFYGLAGNINVGAALMARLEAKVPAVDLAALEPFDAVCVLGGAIGGKDPRGRPQLTLAGDRIYLAARLWHEGKARLLVASGVTGSERTWILNGGADTRSLWRGLGVPDSAILVVAEPCWVTRDEIAAYRRLQIRLGWKRTALLSSASHLPRALALAQKAGLEVTPVGADWRGYPPAFELQSLVPQMEGFMDVQRACWEFLGRFVGR